MEKNSSLPVSLTGSQTFFMAYYVIFIHQVYPLLKSLLTLRLCSVISSLKFGQLPMASKKFSPHPSHTHVIVASDWELYLEGVCFKQCQCLSLMHQHHLSAKKQKTKESNKCNFWDELCANKFFCPSEFHTWGPVVNLSLISQQSQNISQFYHKTTRDMHMESSSSVNHRLDTIVYEYIIRYIIRSLFLWNLH